VLLSRRVSYARAAALDGGCTGRSPVSHVVVVVVLVVLLGHEGSKQDDDGSPL
jgi:hypothetical protein